MRPALLLTAALALAPGCEKSKGEVPSQSPALIAKVQEVKATCSRLFSESGPQRVEKRTRVGKEIKIEMHTKDQDCTVLREDNEASRSRTKRSVGVREGKKVTTCAIIEEDRGNRLTCGADTTKDPQMVQSFAAFLSELTK